MPRSRGRRTNPKPANIFKKRPNAETSSRIIPIASPSTSELNEKQRVSKSVCNDLGVWNIFRLSVFSVCTAILFYQANEFRKRFFTYPTSVNIGKTSFSKRGSFPLPAVTVCFENIASSKLCKHYPHLCERSEQFSKSCPNRIHYCDVPKRGFHKDSSGEVEKIMIRLISNEENTVYFLNHHNKSHFTKTFAELDRNRFVTCFSKNLHLNDSEEGTFADNRGVKEDPSPDYLFGLYLKVLPYELTIDPWHAPRIFFAVHSPFEPVNPALEGVTLDIESDYFMQITRLEEDHLLPYPYRTNCLDYEALWKENDRTGPRSQKVCFEQCRANYFRECAGCESGMTMYETLTHYCRNFTARKCFSQDKKEEFRRRMESCNLKCKPYCLKLKYYYKTEKFDQRRTDGNGYYFYHRQSGYHYTVSCSYVWRRRTVQLHRRLDGLLAGHFSLVSHWHHRKRMAKNSTSEGKDQKSDKSVILAHQRCHFFHQSSDHQCYMAHGFFVIAILSLLPCLH